MPELRQRNTTSYDGTSTDELIRKLNKAQQELDESTALDALEGSGDGKTVKRAPLDAKQLAGHNYSACLLTVLGVLALLVDDQLGLRADDTGHAVSFFLFRRRSRRRPPGDDVVEGHLVAQRIVIVQLLTPVLEALFAHLLADVLVRLVDVVGDVLVGAERVYQSGVTARLKSYTHMSSNFDQLFPQSGIRVLFLKQFPRRMRGETGVSIVARVETRLKQILREMDRSVMGRGSEVFRINPEELFQIIEDIGNADASYEPRRQSERFGKTLLWLIRDSDTGKQTMMFAEDYDEVLLKFAHDNDIDLLD